MQANQALPEVTYQLRASNTEDPQNVGIKLVCNEAHSQKRRCAQKESKLAFKCVRLVNAVSGLPATHGLGTKSRNSVTRPIGAGSSGSEEFIPGPIIGANFWHRSGLLDNGCTECATAHEQRKIQTVRQWHSGSVPICGLCRTSWGRTGQRLA